MELKDALLILSTLLRDLPRTTTAIGHIESQLRSVRDGAGGIIQAGINPATMREIQGTASAALEDCDRLRAKLAVIHRGLSASVPGA